MNRSIRSITTAVALCLSLGSAVHAKKQPIIIERGDSKLKIAGKLKTEHFFEDNAHLLNKSIPDQNEYFKYNASLRFHYFYKNSVEAYLDIYNKGVWGKALSYADRDAGLIGPSNIRFNKDVDAVFGSHSHTSGKPLTWLKEAWLKFDLNAVCRSTSEKRHFVKIGWFPFALDPRGIAFGSVYGLNKEILGLYSYPEDKSAPGILLSGELVKDKLWYDIYYAKFEERSKGFGDTINLEKTHIVGKRDFPWRGVNKDDEVIAARLKWRAFNSETCGMLDLVPFVFYNEASDQKVEIAPDAKTTWGSYGLSAEYVNDDFECGGEFAINYGEEKLFNIDRNKAQVVNRDGLLAEEYTHIIDTKNAGKNALVTGTSTGTMKTGSRGAAVQNFFENGKPIPGFTQFENKSNRFRCAYTNKFRGWMAVADGAYNFSKWNTKLALAYGYASGDNNPHDVEKNKNFNGFVGLHEFYTGKRVKSWFLLNRRVLKQPSISVISGKTRVQDDVTFSDLHHVGFGGTWTPGYRKLNINANILTYWKAHRSNAVDFETGEAIECNNARLHLGTELNLLSSIQLLPDLKLFGNFAVFLPGGFYKDVRGVKVGKDVFQTIVDDPRNDADGASLFRISDDNAYEMNIGLEYSF